MSLEEISGVFDGYRYDLMELEKMFAILPEPSYAEVSLYGDFDFSDVSRQTEEVVNGVKVCPTENRRFRLKNVSKELLLRIWRNFEERDDIINKIVECGRDPDSEIPKRRIYIEKVGWDIPADEVKIEFSRDQIKIRYPNKEPDYVSALREQLAGPVKELRLIPERPSYI